MATSLWVHLKEAKVIEPVSGNRVEVQVCLRLGSRSLFLSTRASSPNPMWDEDINFSVDDAEMMGSLLVELVKPKFLFRSDLLGKTSIPLLSVRHSNKSNSGYWFNLFVPSADGSSSIPTQHQICIDTHFELPKDLPPDVVEALEKKLEMYNSVLDKEVEVIETQEHRLITGNLAPPPKDVIPADQIDGGYSLTSSLPDITVESEPEPPYENSSRVTPVIIEVDSPRTSRLSNHSSRKNSLDVRGSRESLRYDDSLNFDGFEWNRDSQSPEPSFGKRESHPSVTQHKRSDSLTTSKLTRSLEHRRVIQKRIDNGRRASSPRTGAVARIEFSRRASMNRSMESTGSLNTISPGISDKVRSRWIEAMKSVGESQSKAPGPKGLGNFTISQLVDQLKSYKIKSKELNEQGVETFSTANSKFRIRSRSVLDGKRRMLLRKHHMDEQVRLNVFKRTVEALLYPASEPDSHCFVTWSARKPTACSECNYPLWGLTRQGVKCSRCSKICHERCSTLCSQNCYIHDQQSAVRDKMQRMLVNHVNRFDLMKEAFSMSSEQHIMLRKEIEARILKMLEDYRADIVITVIAVQGVFVPKNLHHRMYVSVAVGNQRMKTEVFKKKGEDKSPPTWNQEFTFMCLNCSDLIQLRVWNERDSAVARVANKFTKEGDLFLGEKIVEVQKVGLSQDVWYKLEKRTEKGQEVSGHIKVNISVTVEGERVASFHHYYTKLHEQLFIHCHIHNDSDLVIVPAKQRNTEEQILSGHKSLQVLPTVAQEVLDEFSLRYGVEGIFRMMLHIELLVNHHSMKHALLVINNMLKNLKYQMFIHVAADHAARGVGATVLMEEYMDASNFGRDKFFQVLDKLLNALKLDLQQYREFYPHKDDQKLLELLETFELMGTVIEFQQQAMGIFTTNKISELILDNMKECLKNTFEFIIQSSMAGDNDDTKHPALDANRQPFEFFYQILTQLKGVILEDRTVYGKIIAKYCNVNFGDVSAVELWLLFSSTVEGLFEPDENLEIFAPNEYVTLLFTIKTFYDAEIKPIPSRQSKVPEFPRWFVRCVQKWLLKYQKDGIFFVDNAWDDDRNGLKFSPHENQKLSSSAFQMFFYLHQGLEFTQSLESSDLEVKHMHIEDFSMVIINVVQHYVDKVSLAIPEYNDDLETMCMLLNNLQVLRTNIHLLFDGMGGTENAGAGASKVLTEFQQQLSKQLTTWCTHVARSLSSEIHSAIKVVQSSLIKLKGQGNVERDEVKTIIEPLLDLLSTKLSIIVSASDQIVLQKCIKEVWYACLENLHQMLLPMLKWEHGDHALSFNSSCSQFDYPLHNYTHRQCSALEIMIEVFKEFFVVAEDQGVKRSTIERGIKQLKAVITLYRETTDMLISDFIVDETRNGLQTTDASCGEVHLEIDAYSHPATGELDGNIRVISATDLKPLGGAVAIKPAIELNLLAPTMSTNQRKFITTTKGSPNPNFNQNFKFTLASNWENSELLVLAKQKAHFGKDRVIGLAIVPFSSIKEQASLTLGLAPNSPISDRGRAILNVLTVRGDDNFAKEFVTLKTSQRSSCEE